MKKLQFYRPAIACFIGMMNFALLSSGLSFFVSVVSEDLGVGRGSFSLYYSLMAIASAFAAPTLGKIAGKKGVRGLLMISGVWVLAGMFLFSVSNSLWMFYLVGLFTGLMGSGCAMLCVNVALQQNYDAKTMSAITGVVMAGSGVGGMILSAVMPGILETVGWRNGYRIVGVLWVALIALCLLVMGKPRTPVQSADGKAAQAEASLTQAQMVKMPVTWLLVLEAAVLAAACGLLQQYPALLGGMGFNTAAVAAMMSLMTASMAVGKIALGALYSKGGAGKGGAVAIAIFVAGLLLLVLPQAVYPALILTALGLGVYTTLMPVVTRKVFGGSFAAAWGMVQLGGSAGSFIGVPVWGAVYDAAGSYVPAQIAFAVALAAILGVHLMITREKKNG